MPLAIHEIISNTGKLESFEEKVEYLSRVGKSVAVQTLLRFAYDKSLEILLPDTPPPYKRMPDIAGHGIMYNEAPKLIKIYTKSGMYPNMSKVKREGLFISLLEDIDGSDADMLVQAISLKGFDGISLEVVKAAFPGLIAD